MNVWALSAFLTVCVVVPLIIIRRNELARPISAHLGDTIPERSDKTPIEEF